MNKLISLSLAVTTFFLSAPHVAAADTLHIDIKNTSGQGIDPSAEPGTIISNAIAVIYIVGVLAMLLMLVLGAFNWITSGGDKEAVGKARARIINALIGLLLLAVTFLIAKLAGQIVHIDPFKLDLPSLDKK